MASKSFTDRFYDTKCLYCTILRLKVDGKRFGEVRAYIKGRKQYVAVNAHYESTGTVKELTKKILKSDYLIEGSGQNYNNVAATRLFEKLGIEYDGLQISGKKLSEVVQIVFSKHLGVQVEVESIL